MHDLAAVALLPAGLMDVLPPFAAYEARTVERLIGHFAGENDCADARLARELLAI